MKRKRTQQRWLATNGMPLGSVWIPTTYTSTERTNRTTMDRTEACRGARRHAGGGSPPGLDWTAQYAAYISNNLIITLAANIGTTGGIPWYTPSVRLVYIT